MENYEIKSGGYRLLKEKSPYLLQHAHNPVEWFPWGNEAVEKAKKEEKPIFLSIGYSSCHWCHVMAQESFEDAKIAEILNKNFVSIKVDREERPDIDQIYLFFVQLLNGNAGWPASIWLTPELKPFFTGTYFPAEDKYGQIGFKSILQRLAYLWSEDRNKIYQIADEIDKNITQRFVLHISVVKDCDYNQLIEDCFEYLMDNFDSSNGGFFIAPKFPQPLMINFLLHYFTLKKKKNALNAALFTLKKIAEGGIHDHLGGGFHRYSVDEKWHLPHFEKMLYDQAQLAEQYLLAFELSREQSFAKIARSTLAYIMEYLSGSFGEFFSAEDADTPIPDNPEVHSEGAFYLWTYAEICNILSRDESRVFNYVFGIVPQGNIEIDPKGEFQGKNILNQIHSIQETADFFNKSQDEVLLMIESSKTKLLSERKRRPRPRLDDKAICSWNCLAISAFASAKNILGDSMYLNRAEAGIKFIIDKLYDEKTNFLLRRYCKGESAVHGLLSDYAFFIKALLDVFEVSSKKDYLKLALKLQEKQDELFFNHESGTYYISPADDKLLLYRPREFFESTEPSGNSISAENLLRISQFTGDKKYTDKAHRLFNSYLATLSNTPSSMPRMVSVCMSHILQN